MKSYRIPNRKESFEPNIFGAFAVHFRGRDRLPLRFWVSHIDIQNNLGFETPIDNWYFFICPGKRLKDAMSHRIHVWYIYLHLVDFCGKCGVNTPYMDRMGIANTLPVTNNASSKESIHGWSRWKLRLEKSNTFNLANLWRCPYRLKPFVFLSLQLPKTNIAPKKSEGFEDDFPLTKGDFHMPW